MRIVPAVALLALAAVVPAAGDQAPPTNPAIDMAGYLRLASEAASHRASRRLSEAEFLRLSREPDTVVLDARSRERYDELHIAGAINLSFPDITIASLQQLLPNRQTRVLIYCNNNFTHAEHAFPSKLPPASLNLSTYIALYTYGYPNVYELGPLIDIHASKLPFEGTAAHELLGGAVPAAAEAAPDPGSLLGP